MGAARAWAARAWAARAWAGGEEVGGEEVGGEEGCPLDPTVGPKADRFHASGSAQAAVELAGVGTIPPCGRGSSGCGRAGSTGSAGSAGAREERGLGWDPWIRDPHAPAAERERGDPISAGWRLRSGDPALVGAGDAAGAGDAGGPLSWVEREGDRREMRAD